jgi:hypothetical protein
LTRTNAEVGMNRTEPTWSVPSEIPAVVLSPRHLRRTVCVAALVGTAFFAMNQLGIILAGHATGLVWLKATLTYLTPLLVSNYGVLSATRCPSRDHPRRTGP